MISCENEKQVQYNGYMIGNIWLIGCGGIGSHLLGMLARELYFRLYIQQKHPDHRRTGILPDRSKSLILVDGDHVEEKNLFRQDFGLRHLNMSKAEAMANRYRPGLEKVGLNVEHRQIWIDKGFSQFEDYDIILSCVDNNATRKIINDILMDGSGGGRRPQYAVFISGGNRDTLATVHVDIIDSGRHVTAPIVHNQPEISNPDDNHPKDESCMDEVSFLKDPQVYRANHMAATLMFNAFVNIMDQRWFDYCQIWADVGDMSYRKEPIPEKWNIVND